MGSCTLLRPLSSVVLLLVVLQVVQCQCEDYVSEKTTTCSMLFQKFQSALIGSELNLYNLRKTFSPASRPAPILVNVSYEISFGHVSNDLCPGTDNTSTLFNTSDTQYLNYGWTSSVLYKYFHPAVLNQLQPQLVFLFLKRLEVDPEDVNKHVATAFTWDGYGPITTAEVSLYISRLPCSPSYEGVYRTLRDISSLINIYTEVQTNLTTWNTKNAGYVINGSAFSNNVHFWRYGDDGFPIMYIYFGLLSTLIAFVLTAVIMYMLCTHTPENSESDEMKVWRSVFWTSFGILTQCSVVFLLVDFVQVGNWCPTSTGCNIAAVIKILWFALTGGLCGLYLTSYAEATRKQGLSSVSFVFVEGKELSLLFPPFISPFCFVLCQSHRVSKASAAILNFILVPTLVTLFSTVFFYLIPILLLLVAYPIKVAASYSFLAAALILNILTTFYVEYQRVLFGDKERCKGFSFLYLSLFFFNTMLIAILLFFFFSVYNVLSSGYAGNSVFHAVVSFLPSLILSSFIWLFKTRFLNWLLVKAREQTFEQDATSDMDTSLQINGQESSENEQNTTSTADTVLQSDREQENSEDATSDVDTQQEHSEQEHLLHQQTQNGTEIEEFV